MSDKPSTTPHTPLPVNFIQLTIDRLKEIDEAGDLEAFATCLELEEEELFWKLFQTLTEQGLVQ